MSARLNLEQLRAFLTVVRLGGIRKAADALNLTQPAVSTRIKNLETTLGAELFERSAGGVHLTKRGDLLVRYAEQFQQLSEMVNKDVMDPAGVEGHLRLGVAETIAQCWLPEFVGALHQRYPTVEIEINVDISVNLREALLSREIDLAILLGPISDYQVDNVDLPDFALSWYCAADAPEPAEGPTGFLRKPIITYARNTRPFRELTSALFERVGPQVRVFPSSSLLACFRLVEAGLGVGALPRALGRQLEAEGRLRAFDPGWLPGPLRFSASFLAEPKSHMVETAALAARQVALDYVDDK